MPLRAPGPASGVPAGCRSGVLLFAFLFLVPYFFAHVLLAALGRLGLSPEAALLALAGIFLGGTVNIPVTRVEREREVPVSGSLFGLGELRRRIGWTGSPPVRRRVRSRTVIAVNLGGCVVPCLLAAYEAVRVLQRGTGAFAALLA